jgi:hypothetical protein
MTGPRRIGIPGVELEIEVLSIAGAAASWKQPRSAPHSRAAAAAGI